MVVILVGLPGATMQSMVMMTACLKDLFSLRGPTLKMMVGTTTAMTMETATLPPAQQGAPLHRRCRDQRPALGPAATDSSSSSSSDEDDAAAITRSAESHTPPPVLPRQKQHTATTRRTEQTKSPLSPV